MAASKPLIVVAIDFGTTYSGWAYSFSHEFESDPTKARTKIWNSGLWSSLKTSTCVLIGPDKKFVAFGYEAEDIYDCLVDEDENYKQYFYFKRFKMMLNKKLGEKIDRNITIEDEMGNSLPALLVFSMSIEYLVDDMWKVFNIQSTGLFEMNDVHWVLTVPAIWTDAAKQFMRVAANKAGINDKRLTIALESEAGFLYCHYLPIKKRVDQKWLPFSQFKAGTRYMVLDAGGGMVESTVHEITRKGDIKEVQAASGRCCGGILVDKAFEELIVDIVTPDNYERFKKNKTEDWLDLWRRFEAVKRAVTSKSSSRIQMRFPESLIDMYTETALKERLTKLRYTEVVKIERGKIRFDAQFFLRLFDTSIQNTVSHVDSILKDRSVKAILMVGGMSESPVLQNAIKSQFEGRGLDIIIPMEASSAILRGALIYGHSPMSITERVLKYTYGVAARRDFVDGLHAEEYRVETDIGPQCRYIFDKHVGINQAVRVGEPQVVKAYSPTKKFQRSISYKIYASTEKNPQYVTDDGCTHLGKLVVKVPEPDDDLCREIEVSLTFSGTEIMVEARDCKTGSKYSTTVDFLG